jgi:hypothetical protein
MGRTRRLSEGSSEVSPNYSINQSESLYEIYRPVVVYSTATTSRNWSLHLFLLMKSAASILLMEKSVQRGVQQEDERGEMCGQEAAVKDSKGNPWNSFPKGILFILKIC